MEESPVLSAVQAIQALKDCYESFVKKLECSKTTSVGEVVGFLFRSQGNPKVNYAVSEFDPVVTEQVAALADCLSGCPADEANGLTLQALEHMLFYPIPKDSSIAFSLAAFEGKALPLVPFLTPKDRQELARRYARRTQPRQMLPNQNKLWSALSRP